jgi:hypothetical protein
LIVFENVSEFKPWKWLVVTASLNLGQKSAPSNRLSTPEGFSRPPGLPSPSGGLPSGTTEA